MKRKWRKTRTTDDDDDDDDDAWRGGGGDGDLSGGGGVFTWMAAVTNENTLPFWFKIASTHYHLQHFP